MSRKPTWEEGIRRTCAILTLAQEQHHLFPVQEIQEVTNAFLRNQSSRLVRRAIEPFSDECELALIDQINEFYNEINGREAGILACLHVLSREIALGQLDDLRRRREVADEFLLRKLRAYLQCLLIAHRIRPDVCTSHDYLVAKDLFDLVKENDAPETLPSVGRILDAVHKGTCEHLLPESMIRMILRHVCYKQSLQEQLNELLQTRGWYEAHQLVRGLRERSLNDRHRHSNEGSLLHDVYPDVPMWASWSPSRTRIKLWENPSLVPFRAALAPIFDFEGPDTTGNQLPTLRQSSPGMYGLGVYQIPASNGRPILEQLLQVFDSCVGRGPEAVRIFITLCVEPRKLSWQGLERVEAALELRADSDIKALDDFLRAANQGDDLFGWMQGIANAMPIIKTTRRLQAAFGNVHDLANRGPQAIFQAQTKLCKKLKNSQASERFAKHVVRLGRALLVADWLHQYWPDKFMDMLRQLPTEASVATVFRMMNAAPPDLVSLYRDAIASRVGASHRAGASSAAVAAATSNLFVTDLAWTTPLDYEREGLRYLFLRATMQGFDSSHAVACIKQSEKEHDSFIRDMRDLMDASDTDLSCVKLAGIFARAKSVSSGNVRPVPECWRQLLMHLMRQRPPGMLERCEEALSSTSWVNWTRNLQLLYGDTHFDPRGGLGFTPDKFNAVTARKIAIGRTMSTSTTSTGSTGRFSMGRR